MAVLHARVQAGATYTLRIKYFLLLSSKKASHPDGVIIIFGGHGIFFTGEEVNFNADMEFEYCPFFSLKFLC